MAQRFLDQATAQIAPVYDQQIQQAQAQIPALQQLYQSLLGGLEASSQQQIQTGSQNIVEDASRRGVLRSTLPVDARTSLESSIGAALAESKGQLGLRQMQDIAGIQERVGGLQAQRVSAINQIANQLYEQDLAQQELQQKMALASMGGGGGGGGGSSSSQPALPKLQAARGEVVSYLMSKAGKDGYVSPNVYKRVKNEFLAAGFTEKQWLEAAKRFKNPKTKY